MGMPSHLATESGWCASPRHRVFSPPERRAELVEGLILPKWLAAGSLKANSSCQWEHQNCSPLALRRQSQMLVICGRRGRGTLSPPPAGGESDFNVLASRRGAPSSELSVRNRKRGDRRSHQPARIESTIWKKCSPTNPLLSLYFESFLQKSHPILSPPFPTTR